MFRLARIPVSCVTSRSLYQTGVFVAGNAFYVEKDIKTQLNSLLHYPVYSSAFAISNLCWG